MELNSTLPVQSIQDYFTLMSGEFELNFFGQKFIKVNKEKNTLKIVHLSIVIAIVVIVLVFSRWNRK